MMIEIEGKMKKVIFFACPLGGRVRLGEIDQFGTFLENTRQKNHVLERRRKKIKAVKKFYELDSKFRLFLNPTLLKTKKNRQDLMYTNLKRKLKSIEI